MDWSSSTSMRESKPSSPTSVCSALRLPCGKAEMRATASSTLAVTWGFTSTTGAGAGAASLRSGSFDETRFEKLTGFACAWPFVWPWPLAPFAAGAGPLTTAGITTGCCITVAPTAPPAAACSVVTCAIACASCGAWPWASDAMALDCAFRISAWLCSSCICCWKRAMRSFMGTPRLVGREGEEKSDAPAAAPAGGDGATRGCRGARCTRSTAQYRCVSSSDGGSSAISGRSNSGAAFTGAPFTHSAPSVWRNAITPSAPSADPSV